MPILIPDIFRNPMAYLQAEALLRSLFDRIKCEDYQGPMWTQWMTTTGIDGTRFYDDGAPVYSQVCEERARAITVWIVDPQDAQGSSNIFRALMEPYGEYGEIDVLDISCVLTDENLATAEQLIRLYMVDDQTPEAMTLHIEALLPNDKGRGRAKHSLALASLDYGSRKHFCRLRDVVRPCAASYDATLKPGNVFNASMRFGEPGGGQEVVVSAQAKHDGEKTRLSYHLGKSNGEGRRQGPMAEISAACDAPGDARLVKQWLDALAQFVDENLQPLP